MRSPFLLCFLCWLCLSPLSGEIGKIPPGYRRIFNGKDLKGWHPSRISHHGTTLGARVENGELVIRHNPVGEGGILLTDRRYRDFELYLEVKPDFGADGGIFLRSNEEGNAYQITIDYIPRGGIGALITEGITPMKGTGQRRPPDWQKIWKKDDWNSFRVRMTGVVPHITVWMNDIQIADYTDDSNHASGGATDGMIALQAHFSNPTVPRFIPGGMHRFRSIAIKELK